MPNIINKYIDDYWFSTNIIDCCNIVSTNNTQNLYIANKKLNNNKSQKYNNYNNGEQSCRNISIAESDINNNNTENRTEKSINRIQTSNNDEYYKKRTNKHYTFHKDNNTNHNQRNMYSMPPKSRIYDIPTRESMLDPFTKTKLNIKPTSDSRKNSYTHTKLNIKPTLKLNIKSNI